MKILRSARTLALVVAGAGLVACGGGMSGTYEDQMGMSRLTFESNGTVVQSVEMAGVEKEMRYEVDGEKIRIRSDDGQGATLVLTRVDDQTLSGPMGITFKLKE